MNKSNLLTYSFNILNFDLQLLFREQVFCYNGSHDIAPSPPPPPPPPPPQKKKKKKTQKKQKKKKVYIRYYEE